MLSTKITKINNRWHCRLLKNDNVIDEMICSNKCDIGFCCHEMLRWYDKLGGVDKMASSSRARWHKTNRPIGKIWYKSQLER
jgi:hypothetical protein